ncbi:hypothetical protein PHLCEN_2v10566 [Hermanssonia centrifuga]|uniref:Golgi apparatus membrane protein TVP38 n=1 Tax=Hermanssonia centrifuga TaxID=98765 RepID=A0A2R6NMN5_9APHY|nr:hypothetical protein PHLCEN_2v10566 [Hermanssonia centrifuga]
MDKTDSNTQRLGQPSRDTSSTPSVGQPSVYQHAQPPSLHVWSNEIFNEKSDKGFHAQSQRALNIPSTPSLPTHQSRLPSQYSSRASSTPFSISSRPAPSIAYTRPRGLRITNLFKPWIPIILYAITSLGFLAAIAFWKTEVFEGLDEFSRWLKSDEYVGYAAIFLLIFITTFPPVPLYSTLIILSGYTFGPWTGAIISYCASLTGALTVFILSRTLFRASISRWLSCTITIKRVVRAIEKRPKLLFLIRLAPYPFNVMNCLLAASPSLTLRTYTLCTALSLFKLIIHTSMGSSIRSFAEYHVTKPGQSTPNHGEDSMLGQYSTIAGISLCVAIFIYLSYVARRAVDDELEDDMMPVRDNEETLAFLSYQEGSSRDMEEVIESRPASRMDDRFVYAGREEECVGLGL